MNQEDISVKVEIYRWAGQWGPFKVKIPCGECTLTVDIIKDTLNKELDGIRVDLDIKDWLSNWWKPLTAGGWHAPIVVVEGAVVSQGVALNRGALTEAVIDAYAKKTSVQGSIVFGKENCPYCHKSKDMLDKAGVNYTYFDVVESPRALYEMLARVKPLVGPKTPITTPQIWLDGHYIGGADQLTEHLEANQKEAA